MQEKSLGSILGAPYRSWLLHRAPETVARSQASQLDFTLSGAALFKVFLAVNL